MSIVDLGTQNIMTDRLKLRRFNQSDIADMIKFWISNPEVQNNYGEPVYSTEAEVSKLLDQWQSSYENKDFYKWAIVEKDSNTNIGQIGFYKVNGRNHVLDVEYCISDEYSGRGYATEALKAVINYGLEHLEYNRVQAFHRSKNSVSGRVLKKSGMTYEGTLKQHVRHNNEYDDCLVYGVIREQW